MKHAAHASWSTRAADLTEKPGRRVLRTASSLLAIAAVIAVLGPFIFSQNSTETSQDRNETAQTDTTLAPPTKEFMIAGYGGMPYTYDSDVSIEAPGSHDFTAKDVEWEGKPFKAPIYYGVRIVRWLEGGATGAMLDFTHSKTIARLSKETSFTGTINGAPAPEKAKLGDIFRRLEASHGHNMLTLNGLLRLPSIGPRFFPYIGIGGGVSLPHSEVQMKTAPGRTYEYQYTGPAFQGLIGIEFRIPRMSYFFEYKFTFASYQMPLTHRDGTLLIFDIWRQLKRAWAGELPPGGYLSTLLASHEGIAGLGVRLGAQPAAN